MQQHNNNDREILVITKSALKANLRDSFHGS